MSSSDPFETRIAYFSMEIALHSEIPTYSGGLGVLAGDTLRSAAELELPMVAVTLASRSGYFHQRLDPKGRQIAEPDIWNPAQWAEPLSARVALNIGERRVWIGGWLYQLKNHTSTPLPVVLLDTDIDENHPDDRTITDQLYSGDIAHRLKQEMVLGIGGVRLLRALGFEIRQYHMNEGHSALLALELLRHYAYPAENRQPDEPTYDVARVRSLCNFTTHTPVEAGHDRFPYPLVQHLMGEMVDEATLKRLAGGDDLNMTRLALNLSEYINGVAKRHAEVSRQMFPGYRVHAITNGVHPFTWTCSSFSQLFNAHIPSWCHEPELLARADCCLTDDDVWRAHLQAKQQLSAAVAERCSVQLDITLPLLGFARRMTAYKRPELLFSDLERLRQIARRSPFQIVLAGKAHPRDGGGQALIEQLHRYMGELADDITIAYLPNYNVDTAKLMIAGVDIWLNTPQPPLEASGTSGMKAAFNGVPSLSVLDGWWIEGCIEGVTGWAIGDAADSGRDAQSLYDKLENQVLPLYSNRAGWIKIMKAAISKNATLFNSHRMMRRYATEAYIR